LRALVAAETKTDLGSAEIKITPKEIQGRARQQLQQSFVAGALHAPKAALKAAATRIPGACNAPATIAPSVDNQIELKLLQTCTQLAKAPAKNPYMR